MRYKILRANTIEELEEIVDDHVGKGWTCIGGVAVTLLTHEQLIREYYQSVYRRRPAPLNPLAFIAAFAFITFFLVGQKVLTG